MDKAPKHPAEQLDKEISAIEIDLVATFYGVKCVANKAEHLSHLPHLEDIESDLIDYIREQYPTWKARGSGRRCKIKKEPLGSFHL